MSNQYQDYLAEQGFDLSDLEPNYNLSVAAKKANCLKIIHAYKEEIIEYQQQIDNKELPFNNPTIILVDVDDENGSYLADILMPNYDWQKLRDEGSKPFMRGVIHRKLIAKQIAVIDERKAMYINQNKKLQIIVVSSGIIEIFGIHIISSK